MERRLHTRHRARTAVYVSVPGRPGKLCRARNLSANGVFIEFDGARGFSSGPVKTCAGPWRTSGDWWKPAGTAWDRDEWDVAMTDGTVYRLVVEREVGQWFLEGVID